jgi:hypothetical protein
MRQQHVEQGHAATAKWNGFSTAAKACFVELEWSEAASHGLAVSRLLAGRDDISAWAGGVEHRQERLAVNRSDNPGSLALLRWAARSPILVIRGGYVCGLKVE